VVDPDILSRFPLEPPLRDLSAIKGGGGWWLSG